MTRYRALVGLGLLPVLLAGCGGSSGAPVASAASPATAASAAPCDTAGATTDAWPSVVPEDLPVPPTTHLTRTDKADGLTLVRFTTKQSVREGVLFLVRSLQPAGFTVGRGDAEAIEADVPFTRGSLRGLMKMIAQEPCSTAWVLALQEGGSGPAPSLPRATTASPSPLPF